MSEFPFFDFEASERRAEKFKAQLDAEINRLRNNDSALLPVVGDRVLVAVGVLLRGHLHLRREAVVTEVATSAVKVHCEERPHYSWDEWVPLFAITDILAPKEKEKER